MCRYQHTENIHTQEENDKNSPFQDPRSCSRSVHWGILYQWNYLMPCYDFYLLSTYHFGTNQFISEREEEELS